MHRQKIKVQKSTKEIKTLIHKSNMNFEAVVNEALNEYLPRIFPSCPLTDDLCPQGKRCVECRTFTGTKK
jgi:hypothetical protein